MISTARFAALLAVAAAAFAGCGSGGTTSQPAAAGTQCTVAKGAMSARTHSYAIALGIGPVEKMWTPAQVERLKPKHGEVMLKGRMAGMSAGSGMAGMSSGTSAMAHLEVHICSRATGRTADVTPAMTVIDRASGRRTAIPVATMEGIGEGHPDLHYGNNVVLPHQAAVEVVVAGEEATLIPPTG